MQNETAHLAFSLWYALFVIRYLDADKILPSTKFMPSY